ncbi:MAG: isoleucine--tRNA ligase [Pirellula sp.]|nr:isoleucine--tRNA ligase [Pirellula sp.]
MFHAVKTDAKFPKLEEEILAFWKQNRIYEKSLELRAAAPAFVFFEGPPTANGMPHPGHCLTRAIKDVFPRYRTMRGFRCDRKAGWDTHGLPVEVEVCKELGIHSKDEIEAYGIEGFIQRCQESVWRYMQEWERMTERLGFWIDLSQAYVTYHQSYIESVWWSLKTLFDRGLLYRGHKIVWWWAQGGTALSAGEVGQGYREVADPSVYVRFPIEGLEKTSLIVWTTTPWTLPSNQFAAVNSQLDYAFCRDDEADETIVVAQALVQSLADKTKRELTIQKTIKGSKLVGLHYTPPFPYYYDQLASDSVALTAGGAERPSWRVVAAPFVTIDSGTGLVHMAPPFGEADYEVLVEQRKRFAEPNQPPLLCPVSPSGKFTSEASDYEGVWVKDADKPITRRLRDEGSLWYQEQYVHDYPFCWRASEDPLIQYPRESWFIRTTSYRDAMLENNQKIGWNPEHIGTGRFGNFLESNVDWAISRERYWGTPLPIWVCDQTGKMEAIGKYEELLAKSGIRGVEVWEQAKAKNPELVDDLRVHKPYIDAVTYDSPFAIGARMTRVTEVIDCWYDSGAMPFAQWGYPHKNAELFKSQFPADFISEAIDQTRGWFYSQLAISTMLFEKETVAYPHPFKNCIVLGLMLAEWYESKDGKQRFLTEEEAREVLGNDLVHKTGKMSKSLRNYRSPQEIFDKYGADALRWYLFANQPPWNSILYSERAIRDSIPEFILRLWNVFSFFTIYAEIDGFQGPSDIVGPLAQLTSKEFAQSPTYRPIGDRSELDRWMMSELAAACKEAVDRMDNYDSYGACQALNALVDALSNWYVRRSRSRYWSADKQSTDKLDAYWTLYESLVIIAKLIAPFTPFLAEVLWRHLKGTLPGVCESVHLCDYPDGSFATTDPTLNTRMALLREIASLGRSARMDAKLKVRQPLGRVEVTMADNTHIEWLKIHDDIVREELNVKEIHYASGASPFVEYSVLPNLRKLDPRVGPLLPKVKQALAIASGALLLEQMTLHSKITLNVDGNKIELDSEDIQVRMSAKAGWAASQGKNCVVALNTELTDSLIREGIAKDAIRLIQDMRKKRQCNFSDRIEVVLQTDVSLIRDAIQENHAFICSETLAVQLSMESTAKSIELEDVELADTTVQLGLCPIT